MDREITEELKNWYEYLGSIYDIKKSSTGLVLEKPFYIEDNHFKSVDPNDKTSNFLNLQEKHNCLSCSHACCASGNDFNMECDILRKFLNQGSDVEFIRYASNVRICEAYDPIDNMNIILDVDDMKKFICRTENVFNSPENFENYWGFKRKWDEDTGEILETTEEYINNGGLFSKIPDKSEYPIVIYFNMGQTPLAWISIKDVLGKR